MRDFPLDAIHATHAEIFPHPIRGASIEIFLEPFKLIDRDGQEVEFADTEIRLDFIEQVDTELSSLQDKTFAFPVNPVDGYIDGSIYFLGSHHPIDVTEIAFGARNGNGMPAVFKVEWNLEFEDSGYRNVSSKITTILVKREV